MFKKGKSGNPNGAPRKSPEYKTLKHVRAIDVERQLNALWNTPAEKLHETIKPEGKTLGELLLARAFYNSILKADKESTNAILDRMVGKVKESLKVESEHTIKIEHLKIHEVRQILQADPFLQKEKHVGSNPRSIEYNGPRSPDEDSLPGAPATSGDCIEVGSGEKRSGGSDQDSSGSE